MARRKPKAPPGCYWRGNTLWGRIKVRGRLVRWSLNTNDPRSQKRVAKLEGASTSRPSTVTPAARSRKRMQLGTRSLSERSARRPPSVICARSSSLRRGSLAGAIRYRRPTVADIIRERQSAGVTNATIKRDLGALSSIMNFCILQGWIEANPVLPKLALVPERRDPIVLPSDQDIALVIERAPGMVGQMIAGRA